MSRLRVAVLVSGRGSNMAALIDAAAEPAFPAEIVAVISNRPNAGALAVAARAGIATVVVDHKAYADRATFDAALDAALRDVEPDLVCLAGFMRILTDGFIAGWAGRLINIHPALLPSFKGLDTHARALAAGVKLHGCTVHVVTPEMDSGPIIAQAAVPVLEGDDEDALAARVLAAEHLLYVRALKLWAQGRVRLDGDRVKVDAGDDAHATALIWP
ncbi:phosphoribosylglycinamide formyltransferase-1 [Methylopila capsulata]|uniref:Phosphoribosylglycinamide formyltransferase n=1 Tax=Methylopila capsulata TaxID=61654 RepID=A0A9W6MRK3_9HYPH|nr:phosphoribosylglycinamide formyltransferase [Methylopila capsulata]MBM7850041.1 phosphoribosylglycinamide formyltransferase-1 [Methylopila capsulata]GLK55332.1 phosphoribosylglycinamide formyltransferase [Methylopila capsulata]